MATESDDVLKRLLLQAGRRPAPPSELTAEVYTRTRLAWQAQVQRRWLVRRAYAWAASFALAVLCSWGAWSQFPHTRLATAAAGQHLLITHTSWHPWAARGEGAIYQGDEVSSGSAGALLRRADGTEFRLAQNSRVSFPSPTDVKLWNGRLFVQTGSAAHSHALVVVTDLGSVEHIGTQFLVDREGGDLIVAVRDGRIALHYAQRAAVELQGGQGAKLDPRGQLERWDLAAFDGIWDWADALAMPLDIDGQSLYAVLDRIAQRSGLALNFATYTAESAARALSLHGAPLALAPRDALNAVLATTTLRGAADGRQILVTAR